MSEAPTSAHSQRLRRKIELVLPDLVAASRRLLGHPLIRDLYPEYLFTSHCIIRASVPLMEAALDRSAAMAGTDPVAAGLVEYLRPHISEEMRHDEWLLEDLEVLGVSRSSVLSRPPSHTVAALVGAQYYWVLHYHPVALLGYMELLEGYPPSTAQVDELIATTGHSPEAFRTLLHHAVLDPDHAQELDATLDRLPLSGEQSTALGLSAMHSVHMLARARDEIVEEFAPRR